MDIKQLRITKKNKLYNDIKILETRIANNTNTLQRLKNSNSTTFIIKQIEDLDRKNVTMTTQSKQIQEDIKNIPLGLFDEEMLREIENNVESAKVQQAINEKKKSSLKNEKIELNNQLQKHYTSENLLKRSSKWLEKDIQREYDKFCRNNATIPDYILENLKNMPSNKGYIHRGIWCFGDLLAEKNKPVVIFENLKGLSLIHECHPNQIITYKKIDKFKKEIVKSTPRTYIQIPSVCGEIPSSSYDDKNRYNFKKNDTQSYTTPSNTSSTSNQQRRRWNKK